MNTESTTVTSKEWATSDYYLASYLMARGFRVTGLDSSQPRRKFLFKDTDPDSRREAIMQYRLEEDDEVSATQLFAAQKRLQWLLRDGC